MDELIKNLKDNPAFTQFEGYIIKIVDGLDTVEGLEQMSNEQAGEEAKIRAKTKDKLVAILQPFIDFAEKKEPTEAEIKKAQEKFGL